MSWCVMLNWKGRELCLFSTVLSVNVNNRRFVMESVYWFILTIALIPLLVVGVAFLAYYFQFQWSHPKLHKHSHH
jgi:hypothetical protein